MADNEKWGPSGLFPVVPSLLPQQRKFGAMQQEFAPGVIRGIRGWSLGGPGRLIGRSVYVPWNPDENVARCLAHVPFFTKSSGWKPGPLGYEHPPPWPGCSCGFWAYFGDADPKQMGGWFVGVIEAYGKTLIGEEGFRAEKARILALAAFKVSPGTRREIQQSYPDAAFFEDVNVMKLEFPPNNATDFGILKGDNSE